MEKIRMVVLTKSSKYGKNCVAGINLASGGWVRLVTNDESSHGAVSDEDLICEDGKSVQVLDVIDAPILEACNTEIQPENVLLDLDTYIDIVGKMTIEEVLSIHPLEARDNILGNIYSYITEARVGSVGYSLTIVEVDDLEIVQEENLDGKIKTKVNFKYNDTQYEDISVTDKDFYSVENGTQYDNAILVVSIGTPYNGKYYKFVSAIYV
jgi:hypothetical protein